MKWQYKVADYVIEIEYSDAVQDSVLDNIQGFGVFSLKKSEDIKAILRYFTYADEKLIESAKIFMEDNASLYSIDFEGINCDFYRDGDRFLFRMHPPKGEIHYFVALPENGAFHVISNYELNPQPILLRFSLWMATAISISYAGGILIHSSTLIYNTKAYLFLGESGTGKSTHTRLCRENVKGAGLLNDDSPLIRVVDGEVYACGSPWSGKTPCYKDEKYPLGGIVRLSQAPYNKIARLSVLKAFAALYPSCPPAFAQDKELSDNICSTLSAIIAKVPVFSMECLPDKDAVLMVKNAFEENYK